MSPRPPKIQRGSIASRNMVLHFFTLALLTLPASDPHGAILDAVRMVESGGRDACPDGDGGKSIGPFQISYAYWLDAVRFEPSLRTTYEDCRDRAYAEKVVRAYMKRYVPQAWETADAEVIARTHNGGPRGVRKRATLQYWAKVRRLLR